MDIDIVNNIRIASRHNLILVKCDNVSLHDTIGQFRRIGVNVINMGIELANKIKTVESEKFLAIEAQEYLHKLMEDRAQEISTCKHKVVAIYNLGILFESSLSLNASLILKEISKNIAIFILWEHHVSPDGILHWGSQQESYNLNLPGMFITEGNKEYEV